MLNRNWVLQPVLPRQEFFTKEIRRLLRGGTRWSQSPVPPRTQRAYETHLSTGSTAVLADGDHCAWPPNNGAPTRSCTGLIRLPSELIADNALRAENWRP